MEKLTIAKLGEEKVINYQNKRTNRPDSFNKVGFQSNEHPQQWYDFTYRGACPLVVGNQYEFEVTPREYNGKTYYDAKLPRTEKSMANLAPVMEAILKMDRNILATLQWMQKVGPTLDLLITRLETKGVLDPISNEPKNTRRIAPTIEYPEAKGPTAFDEELSDEPPLEAYFNEQH